MITKPHARPFTYPITQEYAALGLDPTKIEALYLFDPAGNLYDASGNQRHGDYGASTGFTASGRYGVGMYFDGVDDHVRIPSFSNLGNSNTEISVLVWSKMPSQGASYTLCNFDSVLNERSWSIYNGGNSIASQISEDGINVNKVYFGDINIEDNEWHQKGFVYDGNSSFGGVTGYLQLVLDGAFITQANTTKTANDAITTVHPSSADVTVGCSLTSDTPELFLNSTIDLILIYSGLLNLSHIQNLYNKGL